MAMSAMIESETTMKFGASVWPFQWNPPYDDGIRRIARLGFTAVELIAWDREALDSYYTPATVRHLRGLLADEGLQLSEFVSTPRGMASQDSRERDAAVEHFKRAVEVAAELGTDIMNAVASYPFEIRAPHLTVLPHVQMFQLDYPAGLDWQQNWLDYVEVIRRCCAICEDAGLKFALEPHPHRYMTGAASMLRLIEHVQSPALGMNLDPSHLFPLGELSNAVVYQLRDRILHCHFSDNDGLTNVHWRPGKGKIDWEALLVALRDVGFDGVISIELEDVPGVSRGRAALHGSYGEAAFAGEAFDDENRASVAYLRAICDRLHIPITSS
jgi:sugar phosphate isomerase/epimerase